MTSLPSTGEILVTGGSPGKGAHGPQGEAGSAGVPRSGGEVDVVLFLSSLNPVEVVKESRLVSEVHSERI